MDNQLPPRLAIISHISECLLNYISFNNEDPDDVVEANRVAEDVTDALLRSLNLVVLGGPAKDGRLLVQMTPIVPEE